GASAQLAPEDPCHSGHSEDFHQVARREILVHWDRPGKRAEESIGLGLISSEGDEDRSLFDLWRPKGRKLGREFVHGQRRLVPRPFVVGQHDVDRRFPAESADDCFGQSLRVPKGVPDSLSGNRIHHQSGVADERPTGAVRLAHRVWQIVRAAYWSNAPDGAYSLAQV